MTEQDPEFDDFLRQRRPLFRREVDDGLEPPAELDRLVLRRAREAIRDAEPMPIYRGPRWAAPVAIAATLVLGVGVVFHVADQQAEQPSPAATVENIAQQLGTDAEVAPPPPPSAPRSMAPRSDATLADSPVWRRNSEAWLAEIQRLRAAGETARAEAEMAEYNRQQRAFAASPDR